MSVSSTSSCGRTVASSARVHSDPCGTTMAGWLALPAAVFRAEALAAVALGVAALATVALARVGWGVEALAGGRFGADLAAGLDTGVTFLVAAPGWVAGLDAG